jgi:hypothetical protein
LPILITIKDAVWNFSSIGVLTSFSRTQLKTASGYQKYWLDISTMGQVPHKSVEQKPWMKI